MRTMPRRVRGWLGASLILGAWATGADPAAAQGSGDPGRELQVTGSVAGELVRGERITMEVSATHPGGFASLHTLTVVLSLHGATLEEIVYDSEDGILVVGTHRAIVGTADEAQGRFLGLDGLDVTVATSGDRLAVTLPARVEEDVPSGATFRFTAEDDLGETASTAQVAATEEDGGLPLVPVVVGVAFALLAGGYLGSRISSHRRRSAPSIYGDVYRRLAEERSRAARSDRE
jgi:hypothetical protein